MGDTAELIARLITWLTKRGQPNSGMLFRANDPFRDNAAVVEIWGADAEFIAKNFHGQGATEAADALASLVRERDELQRQIAVRDTLDQHLRADTRAYHGSLMAARGDATPEGKIARQALLLAEQAHRLRSLRAVVRRCMKGDRYLARWPFTYRGIMEQNSKNFAKFKAAEARAIAAEAALEQTRAMYENLEASEVLAGYKNRTEAAEADAARMREALSALVTKLDLVHADEHYKAVWAIAQLHTAPYAGPSYAEELTRARNALGGKDG